MRLIVLRCLFTRGREAVEANVWVTFTADGPTMMASLQFSHSRISRREPISVRSNDPRFAIFEAFSHSDWRVLFHDDPASWGYRAMVVGNPSAGRAEQRGEWVFVPGELGGVAGEPSGPWEPCEGGHRARAILIGEDREQRGWRVAFPNDG